MKQIIVVLVTLGACGIAPHDGGEVAGDNATGANTIGESSGQPTIAPTGTTSGSAAPTMTSTDLQCRATQMKETHADGSWRVHQMNIALVSGVDPTSNYAVEQCMHEIEGYVQGYYWCPEGSTCELVPGGFDPYPVTTAKDLCTWTKGTFWGNQLMINCEDNWTDYSSTGAIVANHQDIWWRSTLHTW